MKLLLALLLASSSVASVPYFRHVHAQTHRDHPGKAKCRHSTVAVIDAARHRSIPARAALYTLPPGGKSARHTFPVVFDGERWHAIDWASGKQQRVKSFSRPMPNLDRLHNAEWASNIGDIKVEKFIGFVDPVTLGGWRKELERFRGR